MRAMAKAWATMPLIGRHAQLAVVDEFLDPAHPGVRALIVEGEAGIGKTVLWREAIERARRSGYRVLSSRAAGPEMQLALAALADLLHSVVHEIVESLPAPQRRALSVALLLEDAHDEAADERVLGAAFLASVRLLARDGPLLIALDDVQWLDAPSAWVLEFALRRLDSEPVRVVASKRTADSKGSFTDLTAALDRDRVERLELGPLTVAAVYELIKTRLGLVLPRPTLVRVHETSGGNPFFALQLAEAIQRSGSDAAPSAVLRVPRQLRGLVANRLGGLSAPTRSTLLHVAALARPSLAVLAAAEEQDAASRSLDEAEAANVVEIIGNEVRFTHPLLASVHYSSATAVQRRAAHARLSKVVTDPEERARHRALAATGADSDVAIALDNAADRARARGAPAAAADLLDLALTLTPHQDRSSLRRRCAEAADAYFAAGDVRRASELLENALETAPRGPGRADILHRLAIVTRMVDGARALEHLQDADSEAEGDKALRARILCSLSHWVFAHQIGFEAMEAAARRAVALAEQADDKEVLSLALGQLAKILFMRGLEMPTGLMERAVALEQQTGTIRVEEDSGASIDYATMLVYTGKFDQARGLLHQLCEHARQAGDSALAYPLHLLAYVHFFAGRWDDAEAAARGALEVALESGRESEEVGARSALGLVEGGRGNVEVARQHLELGLAAAERSGRGARAPRTALGVLELSLGDPESAWRWLEPAVARLVLFGVQVPRPEVAFAIEALIELGRVDEARRLLEPFEERAAALDHRWACAVAARCRGLLLARASLADGETALREVAEMAETVGVPLEVGRSLLTLGNVQRRLGHKQRARATLTEAVSVFASLGAAVWADRARREIGRIGGRVPHDHELSATEREIVELVRAGRSNKEIAAALHLSVKTVEWNLSKIYRKLGVPSRTALVVQRPGP